MGRGLLYFLKKSFVYVFIYFFGTWDLSSPTRNRTRGPCIGSAESQPLDRQGSPGFALFLMARCEQSLVMDLGCRTMAWVAWRLGGDRLTGVQAGDDRREAVRTDRRCFWACAEAESTDCWRIGRAEGLGVGGGRCDGCQSIWPVNRCCGGGEIPPLIPLEFSWRDQ